MRDSQEHVMVMEGWAERHRQLLNGDVEEKDVTGGLVQFLHHLEFVGTDYKHAPLESWMADCTLWALAIQLGTPIIVINADNLIMGRIFETFHSKGDPMFEEWPWEQCIHRHALASRCIVLVFSGGNHYDSTQLASRSR